MRLKRSFMYFSGIIAEYNPLHKGHAHHIALTKQNTKSEYTVIVMSGNFTQRGEPAIFDKWARTRMALSAGADMVLELPVSYALGSAERFAHGAVKIMDSIGISSLCFGSETANLQKLSLVAELLAEEPEQYRTALRKELNKVISFPAAREAAVSSLLGENAGVLSSPNDILGTEYIKAIKRLKSCIRPVPVLREGSGYNDASMSELPSALAIRTALRRGDKTAYSALPISSQIWCAQPVFPEDMTQLLLYALRTRTPQQFAKIYGVSEGMEFKLARECKKCRSYDELLSALKSKRYTLTKIKRMLACVLLNITDELTAEIDSEGLYARVLGIRKTAKPLLSHISKTSIIPVVTQPNSKALSASLALDIRASDVYSLFGGISRAARDFTEGLIISD